MYTTYENLGYNFRNLTGNSADINLILTQLLRRLDFEAYPVVLSSRSNGILSPINPSLFKLNYIVAYIKDGEKPILLDATDQYLPAGMLPERAINGNGRLVDYTKSGWIDLTTPYRSKQTDFYNLVLTNNGEIVGDIERKYLEYGAYNFRKQFKKFNSEEEYAESVMAENPNMLIESYLATNVDSIYLNPSEKLKIRYTLVNKSDSLVYFNPLIINEFRSNPLKSEQRRFPVDFSYPQDYTITINLQLPENSRVTQLPKPAKFAIPNDGGTYQYIMNVSENQIQASIKLRINKPLYTETEYLYLREFFNQLVQKQLENIAISL